MNSGTPAHDVFGARDTFESGAGKLGIYRLSKLEELGLCRVAELPFSIRVLLESVLRNCDGYEVTRAGREEPGRLERHGPGRGGSPVQAGPRRAAGLHRRARRGRSGRDAQRHAAAGRRPQENQSADSRRPGDRSLGAGRSLRRRRRRWITTSTWNSSATASGTSSCVGDKRRSTISASCRRPSASSTRSTWSTWPRAFSSAMTRPARWPLPDTLVGTDSHTTMINGLGVVGWGVGGIEAEAVMLGQPLYMLMPRGGRLRVDRPVAAGRHGDRPGADRHANAPQAKAWSASSSSSSGPACRT